ncbi:MAG: ECF transporter S component [Clostridiales bacterium]|nr:ECF transporter S component [Clostridiales bacterium]
MVLSAMFAALSCAATMVIQIPIATGYLNFGDSLCLLAGWILGPWYGFAAAGLGSALADLLAVLLEQAVCRDRG